MRERTRDGGSGYAGNLGNIFDTDPVSQNRTLFSKYRKRLHLDSIISIIEKIGVFPAEGYFLLTMIYQSSTLNESAYILLSILCPSHHYPFLNPQGVCGWGLVPSYF